MRRNTPSTPIDRKAAALSAVRTVNTEAEGLASLASALNNGLAEPFAEAVELISKISGRLIVTGVGKSGHIGSKIAATMASTGTPAFFVHPAEANHGDLGMIDLDDAILAISWSGETAELKGLSQFDIIRRHAFPNAIAPIVNVIMLNLAFLVVGVVVIEVIFVYPGMGQYLVDHVTKRDVPVVQAVGLIFAAVYITLNMIADIAAILANPRLRHPR